MYRFIVPFGRQVYLLYLLGTRSNHFEASLRESSPQSWDGRTDFNPSHSRWKSYFPAKTRRTTDL